MESRGLKAHLPLTQPMRLAPGGCVRVGSRIQGHSPAGPRAVRPRLGRGKDSGDSRRGEQDPADHSTQPGRGSGALRCYSSAVVRRCRPAPEDRAVVGRRTPRSAALRSPRALDVQRQAVGEPPRSRSRANRATHICTRERSRSPGTSPAGTSDPRPRTWSPGCPVANSALVRIRPASTARPGLSQDTEAGPAALPSPPRQRRDELRLLQAPQVDRGQPLLPRWPPPGFSPSRPRASFVSELALKVM